MKNKSIIITTIAVIVVAGLVWVARPGETSRTAASGINANKGNAAVEIPERSYDFGTVSMAKGNVAHKFKIKNTGTAPLTISKMFTSCMCTVARLAIGETIFGPFGMPGHQSIPRINASLAPGLEAEVEAIFNPAAHGPAGVGRIQRVVTLENSAGAPIAFEFSAVVTP